MAALSLDAAEHRRPAIRRRRTLAYAAATPIAPIAALPVELLRPGNGITLAVCVALVAVTHGLALFTAGGAVPLGVIAGVVLATLLAHLVNTLDEFGPADGAEVPTVLRDGDLYADVVLPLRRLARSIAVCFGPGAIALWLAGGLSGSAWAAVAAGLFAVGLAAWPAVLLTMVEASTPLNLLPHRLLGLARACGRDYPAVVALVAVALATSAVAGVLLVEVGYVVYGRSLLRPASPPPLVPTGSLAYACVASAIYLAHLAAAAIGRLHRLHGDRFPWLLQRHERRATPAAP